jgi:hypothetical protein
MSAPAAIDLEVIDELTGGLVGTFDVLCPLCGPLRLSPAKQRPKLRIYRVNEGFAGFHCVRCGEHGYVRDRSAPRPDPEVLARARFEAAERERIAAAERLSKARWLWSQRCAIRGSIAETYLREARGYCGPLQAMLGFLPARGEYPPAMIAAFGVPTEPVPGTLHIRDADVCGIHITRLAPDGSGKAGGDTNKIMIGRSLGSPIVLAPTNDLLGLAITEGIEDALTVHQGTGLGAWAAGSASRMPALSAAVPSYIEAVTIYAHADDAGQGGALMLAQALADRAEVLVEGLHQ